MGFLTQFACFVVLLCFLPSHVAAIFKEQDGKYNWIHRYLGRYSISRHCGGRFVVGTDEGVVASLKTSDGSIQWRNVFERFEVIHSIDCTVNAVVVVTNGTTPVRVFGQEGALLWEVAGTVNGETDATIFKRADTGRYSLAIAQENRVSTYSLMGGAGEWDVAIPGAGSNSVSRVARSGDEESGKLIVSSIKADSIELYEIDGNKGDVVKRQNVKWRVDVDPDTVVQTTNAVAVASRDGKKICMANVDGQMACENIDATSVLEGLKEFCSGHVSALTQNNVGLFSLVDGQINKEILSTKWGIASSCSSNNLLVLTHSSQAGFIMKFDGERSDTNQIVLPVVDMPTSADGAILPMHHVAVGMGGRYLVQFIDGTVVSGKCSLQDNALGDCQFSWSRSDGLGSIDDSLFVDLPPDTPQNEEEWNARQPSLGQKLFIQMLTLKSQLGFGTQEEVSKIEQHKSLTSDLLRPTRDPDGFRRQIIVATSFGKIVSLHCGDGRILWEWYVGDFSGSLKLVHWHSGENKAEIAVLASNSDGLSVYVLDAFHGTWGRSKLHIPSKNRSILDIIPLEPIVTPSGQQNIYAVLDSNDAILAVLPAKDPNVKNAFESQLSNIIRWRLSHDKEYVIGVRLGSNPSIVWKIKVVADAHDEILDISVRDNTESIYSAARAIFGGSVLMKSINPNMILIVTGSGPESSSQSIMATAIDAVTGNIIYRQKHKVGPLFTIFFNYHML